MAGATTPDGIGYATTGDNVTIAAATALVASTTQTALALRQRYEFVWANAGARTSQTGMVTGSTGYQVDTKAEYIYENSAWRLKTPHAEFTATSASGATGVQIAAGTFSIDSTNSTSSVFATAGASSGQIILTDPGIYLISDYFQTGSALQILNRAFADISNVATFTTPIFRFEMPTSGGDRFGLSFPNYRTTASNTSIYFSYYQTSNTITWSSRVRITRLG